MTCRVERPGSRGPSAGVGESSGIQPDSAPQTPGSESSRNRADRTAALPAGRIARATVRLPVMNGTGRVSDACVDGCLRKETGVGTHSVASRVAAAKGVLDARRLTRTVRQRFATPSTMHGAVRSQDFTASCNDFPWRSGKDSYPQPAGRKFRSIADRRTEQETVPRTELFAAVPSTIDVQPK